MFIVHSKPGCIFCVKAKDFLAKHQLPWSEVEYNPETPDYSERRDALFAQTRHKSFPNVFFANTFLGGFQDLEFMYATGGLSELCNARGIPFAPPVLDF